jgi:hypothetical protein
MNLRLLLLAGAAATHVEDAENTNQNRGKCEHGSSLQSEEREASGVPRAVDRPGDRTKSFAAGWFWTDVAGALVPQGALGGRG